MQTKISRYRHFVCSIKGKLQRLFLSLSANHPWLLNICKSWRTTEMNLEVWLPAMFLLGVTTFGLCLWFLNLCEKI